MSFDSEKKRWEKETLKPVINRYPERKSEFTTLSGISLPITAIPPVEFDYSQKLGFPENFPLQGGSSQQCIGVVFGRCDSMPVTRLPKNPIAISVFAGSGPDRAISCF